VTRFVYQNPASRSTLEIYRNYEQALRSVRFEPIFACAIDTCGPSFARSAWARYNNLFAAADGDPRYLAGTVRTETGTAYVALMVGRARTQLDIVEIKAMETGMTTANADSLASGLERDGRATVGGILFDLDRAVLKPESKPALDELARLLTSRPTLRLYVVGHTDISGDLAHNRQLSEERARAVVKALVENYRIAADRLEGFGVGPLAPAATNATEPGRALNRRVEVVARR
jgi:outer membrane protein OmpA-like peptidoglycan-associated protein